MNNLICSEECPKCFNTGFIIIDHPQNAGYKCAIYCDCGWPVGYELSAEEMRKRIEWHKQQGLIVPMPPEIKAQISNILKGVAI